MNGPRRGQGEVVVLRETIYLQAIHSGLYERNI